MLAIKLIYSVIVCVCVCMHLNWSTHSITSKQVVSELLLEMFFYSIAQTQTYDNISNILLTYYQHMGFPSSLQRWRLFQFPNHFQRKGGSQKSSELRDDSNGRRRPSNEGAMYPKKIFTSFEAMNGGRLSDDHASIRTLDFNVTGFFFQIKIMFVQIKLFILFTDYKHRTCNVTYDRECLCEFSN